MTNILQIHPADNVLVALRDLRAGEQISFGQQTIVLKKPVAAKHKLAVRSLLPGEPIIMYGILVGKVIQPIAAGELITTENISHATAEYSGKTAAYNWQAPDVRQWKDRTFLGYHRSDGQVGTQNLWLVIPLVFCENRNIHIIKEAFLRELGYAQPDLYQQQVRHLLQAYKEGKDLSHLILPEEKYVVKWPRVFQNVDGVKFLTHDSGCGGTRDDALNLCKLLAGYCVNPNVGGITVLSLGCQHAQFEILQQEIHRRNPDFDKPLLFFEQQQWGNEYKMLSEAIRQTFIGLTQLNQLQRRPAPLSKLTVGVKCGGSDGFSGISANPAVGHCADLVVALGGKVVIAEFPELCGVEQELLNRCVNDAIAQKFAHLMKSYNSRAEAVGSGFYMNPSPGNIRDGLITDAIKSAGAARKAGTSPVVDVLKYGEYATKPGLSLLCTPGNDVEATTGKAGAGCNVILFTTGLGTPTGNPVAPMVKIATNTALARRMPDIIDINAGTIIDGSKTVPEVGEEILEYVIGLASGQYLTKAMELGQDDFIFWKQGVSL